jgi:hypothetical protein
MLPLSLSDVRATIMAMARPLSPRDRSQFLRLIALRLHDREIGDGNLNRLCRELQQQFYNAPLSTETH